MTTTNTSKYLVTVHRGSRAGHTYVCASLRAASNKVQRLDSEYGACCASYERIRDTEPMPELECAPTLRSPVGYTDLPFS